MCCVILRRYISDVVLCCLKLVSVSVMLHLMNTVQIDFSSVLVTVWPSFGKELLTRLTVCSLFITFICKYSPFLV